MGVDENIIEEIVRPVLAVARPDKIILSGWGATGEMTPDSDIDLLIVEADPGDRRKESVRLREQLCGLGYPFDVIVISTEWFEESKEVIGGIAYPANNHGKVIHEAARGGQEGDRPPVARQGRPGHEGRRGPAGCGPAPSVSRLLPCSTGR